MVVGGGVDVVMVCVNVDNMCVGWCTNVDVMMGTCGLVYGTTKNTIITDIGGVAQLESKSDPTQRVQYNLADCCNPIPGDKVFGFINRNNLIDIHRVNCPKTVELQSHKHHRVIEAKWTSDQTLAFLAGINLHGIDQLGMVNEITNIVSTDMDINMRSVHFESIDGVFDH